MRPDCAERFWAKAETVRTMSALYRKSLKGTRALC
jgi:hypothetical protein